MPARAFAGSAPQEFTFDITPAKQTVRASIEARFRMTPPDLTRTNLGSSRSEIERE